jgi:hypothetical protein
MDGAARELEALYETEMLTSNGDELDTQEISGITTRGSFPPPDQH